MQSVNKVVVVICKEKHKPKFIACVFLKDFIRRKGLHSEINRRRRLVSARLEELLSQFMFTWFETLLPY